MPMERRDDRAEEGEGQALAAAVLEAIGERLRTERRRQGLTLQAVARQLGVTHSCLSTIERGRTPSVSLAMVARIAAVLGLPLWTLFVPDLERPLWTLFVPPSGAGLLPGARITLDGTAGAQTPGPRPALCGRRRP